MRGRAVGLLLLGACVAANGGCAASSPIATIDSVTRVASPFHGTPVENPYTLPSATWTDTNGAIVRWPADGLPKAATVVIFAYTHCPDTCNTQLADVAQAIRRLDPGVRAKVGLVFVSVDPARDTPSAIRTYLDRFDPSFVGLRSENRVMLAHAAQALGVALAGTAAHEYGYDVSHGAQLIGFGPSRTAPVIWLPGTAVGDLRDDLTTLSSVG